MNTVLITTDFSPASRHGLDYACFLLQDKEVRLDLLHIFPVPVTYTTDGVALAAVSDAIDRATDELEDEVEWARSAYPGIHIHGRLVTGGFIETLRHETLATRPLFMILGTAGFADLYLGDDDPLNALRSVHVPVLFVPQGADLKPLKQVAYACNYASVGDRTPVRDILGWISFIGAHLDVIHADKKAEGADARQASGKAWLWDHLQPLQPDYAWIETQDIVKGITSYVRDQQIDCLLVVPRRFGLIESIFRESRTKALARVNKVPVIAFHERD